jgi:hypothetical protein
VAEGAQGASVYRTGITLRSEKPSSYDLDGYPYHVVLEPRCSCG